MAVDLTFAPEVEWDLNDAYAWYEERRIGLGEDFIQCVDALLADVLRFPEMHPIVYKQYRRALVRRFPYAVFYEFSEGMVTVYAISHTARDPQKWRKRLP